MARQTTIDDIQALADAVGRLALEDSELEYTALAWSLLNRRAAAPGGAGQAAAAADGFRPRALRILGIVCLVLAGDRPDPTRGATASHPHTESPAWADALQPTALLGKQLYYRAPR